MTTAARVEHCLQLERRRAAEPCPIGWAIGAGEGAFVTWPLARAAPTLTGARIPPADRLIARRSAVA